MDDRTAILHCQAGDREAFRHLVEHYQAQALGHAAAILADREDALDVVQEAFLDAFLALSSFQPDRSFYPWFYVVLRNRAYKLLSSRRRRQAESIDAVELLARTEVSEDSIALERALLALEPDERELILLKHLDGLSYHELAERLQIPPGTVMSRLYHARKHLGRQLTRSGIRKAQEVQR
jgi:RNA polymerase sigma-70 factor (ECF subfamily)